jgi:hypothetical protein
MKWHIGNVFSSSHCIILALHISIVVLRFQYEIINEFFSTCEPHLYLHEHYSRLACTAVYTRSCIMQPTLFHCVIVFNRVLFIYAPGTGAADTTTRQIKC